MTKLMTSNTTSMCNKAMLRNSVSCHLLCGAQNRQLTASANGGVNYKEVCVKTTRLLIKYYLFGFLLSVILGFNQYAFKIDIPIYISALASFLILWGLIYSALKDSNAEYNTNSLLSVTFGVTLPNSLAIYFFPNHLGLSAGSAGIASVLSLIFGTAMVWLLFTMSRNMVLSVPLDDEYDS